MPRGRLAVLALLLLSAAPARAAFFELHAGLRAGGATGTGLGGAQKDADFFAGARGGTYGALVGLQLLIIDIYVEHDQFTDLSDFKGTWTQFMVGPHFDFSLDGKLHADLGLAVGFGLGTGQQIMPPLDNAQVSDKGIMLELRVGLEHRMNRLVGIGISIPMAWGYMFKNGVPVNDVSNHYQTFRAMVVGTLTLHFGL